MEQLPIRVPFEPGVAQSLDALLARGAAVARESVTLAALRDALLPELLSGRVRVREAADTIAEVVA
ncbi:hypothetical protein CJ179_39125 [Rhodococcus sp. ACS1]|uniref:restriction endonuclease subunit S n=1 Tax=Rhodococcus sp. ACS1 TaxID=2028570 RepID=UPI000BB136C5|nr:hypothetical protein [Rhodococcus sp. ACS1]PBC38603.1 hypothetical protein CJ179_39125 [Rhodococcus sp. ACS1]